MIQYISYMNIFCDKKFKSLFISLLNKENIINGRQTENRMCACVRLCACVCIAYKFYFVYRRQPFFFFTQNSIFTSAIQIYKRQNLAQLEQ